MDSKIIENPIELYQLLELKFKRFNKYELMYRASRDGFTTTDFRKACRKSGHILVVVKTTQGHIFGGFYNSYYSSSSVIIELIFFMP